MLTVKFYINNCEAFKETLEDMPTQQQ